MKTIHRLAATLAFLILTAAVPAARAQTTQVWVSGSGSDANPCTRALPCATFAAALSQVSAGGEIDCLDAADFGAATITKAVTINCKAAPATVTGGTTPPPSFPGTYYATFANGVPSSPSFFPIGVWFQDPSETGHSGSYSNVAAAAVGEKMNIFFGFSGWPGSFGTDTGGQFAAAVAQKMLVITGGDPTGNTSATSVASVDAINAAHGGATLIGYEWKDEPACGSGEGQQSHVPAEVAAVAAFDPTRVILYNQASWPTYATIMPSLSGCTAAAETALAAPSIPSFDNYPVISPWFNTSTYCLHGANVRASDYNTVSFDCLWTQAMGTAQAIAIIGGTKPFWPFVDTGSDALGYSGQNNSFTGGDTSGSTTLTAPSARFGSAWIGLKVAGSGIPASTTIVSITDSQHAVMSQAATSTNASAGITVTGGTVSSGDCVAAANICVAHGNEFRSTSSQVNSEVWGSLINGASGILYFCHDSTSDSFCMGDQTGGSVATAVAANLTYIDTTIATFATELNAPTAGICSMQNLNGTTASSCTNGILTMATSVAAVPGMALAKTAPGATYLFVESDRVSSSGATMTYTLTGLTGKTATVVYDSDAQYDATHNSTGSTFPLNGSAQFSDTLGANGDNYQVKIYAIQ